MSEIRWTDKVYLDNQCNIRSSGGCPTDQMPQDSINHMKVKYQYHLSCPQCGKTWWDDDAFPSLFCKKCGKEYPHREKYIDMF